MNNLEKYLDRVIVQQPTDHEVPQRLVASPIEPDVEPTFDVIRGILRRWYIVAVVFVAMCAVGAPAIWLLNKPLYVVTGEIRVAPVMTNLISGNEQDYGGTQVYQSFLYTQAKAITSSRVLQRVADDLAGKGLAFLEDPPGRLSRRLARRLNLGGSKAEPADVLKEAILDEIITVAPIKGHQLIEVGVRHTDSGEAARIVDAFMRSYMAVEVTSASEKEEQDLAVMQNEQKVLAGKLDSYRASIGQLAKEYGSKKLAGRYDMNLQRVGSLLSSLTQVEAKRIYLHTQVKLLEQTQQETVPLQEMVRMREEYINKDPAVLALSTNIVTLDQDLIRARQILTETNPQIKQKEQLLEAIRERLDEQKTKAGENFDDLMKRETEGMGDKKLANLKAELDLTEAHENELRELLAKEDAQTIDLGQKDLAIQDLQDQLALTKEMYDTLSRRIQEFEMERKRPTRITVADWANIADIRDKRVKYTAALIMAAGACGVGLAFLRERADKSLRTPDDVARRIGLKIIGTTASANTVKPAHLTEQVAGDYQTIRANLSMLDSNGMPRTLVVTSPGMREGKTTFAINLAISVSKSGRKVLLIDGDLRNPNIASVLGLPKGSRGLQEVLLGKEVRQAICSISSNGLDILAADARNSADAFELLTASLTSQRMKDIGQDYDHVIVDTPPVLAFADALMWAKTVDGVILTCFAGQTTSPDLNKAKERLAEANARLLGTVMTNVEVDQSYYPYGYGRYRRNTASRRAQKKMLLSTQNPQDNTKRS